MNTETIARRIKEQILSFDERLDVREQGRVMSCADGIARVSGLQDVMAGELLYFPHAVRGIAMNLEEDAVGAVLLDDARKVQAGDPVRRSGSVAQVPVGDALLGHVVSALGQPLDGSVLQTEKQRPLEK
ncbi:MAG: F0F1 ATP synthase subunit alpha, partial [Merdibacter sp.]